MNKGMHIWGRTNYIFLALWRWKFLTTAAIAEEFFRGRYADYAYQHMMRLRRRGLVELTYLPRLEGFV